MQIKANVTKLRFSIFVFIIVFLGTFILGAISYSHYKKQAYKIAIEKTLNIAKSIAASVNPQDFRRWDETNKEDINYFTFQKTLSHIKRQTNMTCIYTMVNENKKHYKYIAEGFLPEEENQVTKLGDLDLKEIYVNAPRLVLNTGEAAASKVYYNHEGYGYFISSFAPIKDESDRTIGIVGVDLNVDDVLKQIEGYMFYITGISLIVSIILSIIIHMIFSKQFLNPLKYMNKQVIALAKSNDLITFPQDFSNKKDEIGNFSVSLTKLSKQRISLIHQIDQMNKGIDVEIDLHNNDSLTQSIQEVFNTIQNLNNDTIKVMKQHQKGNIDAAFNVKKYKGIYKSMVENMNHLIQINVEHLNKTMSCVGALVNGNFNHVPDSYLSQNEQEYIKYIKNNLKYMYNEINQMVSNIQAGQFDRRINASAFQGEWHQLVNNINSAVEAIESVLGEFEFALKKMTQGNFDVKIEGIYHSFNQMKENMFLSYKANKRFDQVKKDIQQGACHIETIQTVIEEIIGLEKKLLTKIKYMDEIAFQNNILAINILTKNSKDVEEFQNIPQKAANLAVKSGITSKDALRFMYESIEKIDNVYQSSDYILNVIKKIEKDVNDVAEILKEILEKNNNNQKT